MTDVAEPGLAEFPVGFRGRVISPADADYDEARSLWNADFDRRPALIARCTSDDDVAIALAAARDRGWEVAVRGGGHSHTGASGVDDGLVIDLAELRGVDVDPVAHRATVGGGATWADFDAATQAHGLASTGGIVSHTGVGGLTLGGGMGWLVREHGLAIDNLVAARVVTADGRLLHTSAEEHPDLFWALRGGGGNFGVVTSFTFRLHPVGPEVHLGLLFWELKRGAQALAMIRDRIPAMPERTGVIVAAGLAAPPVPLIPEQHHLTVGNALIVAGFGTASEHAAALAPFRAAVPPLFEFVSPMPYTALQQSFDQTAPWGTYAYDKGLYLDELTDPAIATIIDYLPRKNSLDSFLLMFVLDRQYARVADGATAFGGHRRNGWAVAAAAECRTPQELAADRPWVQALWTALVPHASNAAGYVNFHSEHDAARVRSSYGPETYERLARIKAVYDPHNVFHRNANIAPSGSPTAGP
jgi:FAD/FMN-containing dehydrogenase